MKKIFFLSTVLIMNFIFQSTVKAQDNTQQITALLDSIKNCYLGLHDFDFNYSIKEPKIISKTDSMTSYSHEKTEVYNSKCLCHSYLSYKGTDKNYLQMFYITSLEPKDFYVANNILYLKTYKDDKNISRTITMSNPDISKLLKIKMWMVQLSKYCSAVSVKNK